MTSWTTTVPTEPGFYPAVDPNVREWIFCVDTSGCLKGTVSGGRFVADLCIDGFRFGPRIEFPRSAMEELREAVDLLDRAESEEYFQARSKVVAAARRALRKEAGRDPC